MIIHLILNVFINSMFSFLTILLLIYTLIFLFRIKNPRFIYCALMLPFIKLVTDLFCLNFSNWTFLKGINPYLLEEGMRMLSAKIGLYPFYLPNFSIQFFSKPDYFNFSIGDLFLLQCPFELELFLLVVFLFGVLISTLKCIHKIKAQWRWEKKIQIQSKRVNSTLFDCNLKKIIQKKKVDVLAFKEIKTPVVFGIFKPKLLLPSFFFSKYSIEEQSAIIAHELKHIIWFDILAAYFVTILCHVFWFIPLINRVKKWLFFHREIACDMSAVKQGYNKQVLVSAILKTLDRPAFSLAISFSQIDQIVSRLETILDMKKAHFFEKIILFLFGFFLISIFFGKFWIF